MKKKNICVFCGASASSDPDYSKLANKVGELIGKHNFNLVYGAGNTGLMGDCAKAAKNSGSKIYGVIPSFLTKIEKPLDNINIKFTSNMRTRKAMMYKLSSLFIILPGGIGTLDECVEVLTLIQLKQIKQKKVVIFNFKNYWDFLLKLLKKMKNENFLDKNFHSDLIEINNINKFESFLKSF